jgi:rhodanese-related sulfurtransferase
MTTLVRALAIVALAFIAGTVHALTREAPIVLIRPVVLPSSVAPDAPASTPPVTAPGAGSVDGTDPLDVVHKAGTLTLREGHELWGQGAVFLDARREDQFAEGRISGALWMPASRVGSAESMADLETLLTMPGVVVVIYCDGGNCEASENTATRLSALGVPLDIRIMGAGYEDWRSAGLPVQPESAGLPASGAASGATP